MQPTVYFGSILFLYWCLSSFFFIACVFDDRFTFFIPPFQAPSSSNSSLYPLYTSYRFSIEPSGWRIDEGVFIFFITDADDAAPSRKVRDPYWKSRLHFYFSYIYYPYHSADLMHSIPVAHHETFVKKERIRQRKGGGAKLTIRTLDHLRGVQRSADHVITNKNELPSRR